jgi:hypothetical protein
VAKFSTDDLIYLDSMDQMARKFWSFPFERVSEMTEKFFYRRAHY